MIVIQSKIHLIISVICLANCTKKSGPIFLFSMEIGVQNFMNYWINFFIILSFLSRRYLAKKRVTQIRAEILSQKQNRAALLFQTLWRGYSARQSYKKLQVMLAQHRDDAATIIQKNWKCHVARKDYFATLQSIVKVQSIVRTKLAMKKFCDAKHSAVVIQTCWRGYRTKKLYCQSVKHVTIVQSCVRR